MEYLLIPSACMAVVGFYNIFKLTRRVCEIEKTLMDAVTRHAKRLDAVEKLSLTLPFKYIPDPDDDCDFETI